MKLFPKKSEDRSSVFVSFESADLSWEAALAVPASFDLVARELDLRVPLG
jgi:hypothetical protein